MEQIIISNKRLVTTDKEFNHFIVNINGADVRVHEKINGDGFGMSMKDLCKAFGYSSIDEFKQSEEWNYLNTEFSKKNIHLRSLSSESAPTPTETPITHGFSSPAFYSGGSLDQAVNLAENPYREDDVVSFLVTHSGLLIANNALIRGKIESNKDNNRIVIDPQTRSLKMLYGDLALFEIDFFANGNYAGPRLKSYLYDMQTGLKHTTTEIDGGKVAIYKNDVEFARFDAYQSKIWIDADSLSQNRDDANPKEMYMDGESMKIRRD